jgi:hypothetical protein
MKKHLLPWLLLLAACKPEAQNNRLVTPNGLEYEMHVNVAQEKAVLGDILVIDMKYGTADSLIFDSKSYGRPV